MLTTLLSPDSGTVHIAGVDLSTSPEEVRRLDLHPTPGCSNERVRIFLARELTPTGHPHPRRHKEATLQVARFPLDKALRTLSSSPQGPFPIGLRLARKPSQDKALDPPPGDTTHPTRLLKG